MSILNPAIDADPYILFVFIQAGPLKCDLRTFLGFHIYAYRKTSNKTRTKPQTINVYRLVL